MADTPTELDRLAGQNVTSAEPHPPRAGAPEAPKAQQAPLGGSLISQADRARDQGAWDAAARLYRAALQRNPRSAPIWVQFGHMLKELGKVLEAEAAYRAALSYEPGVADTRLHLANVLCRQDRISEGEAELLRGFAIDQSVAFLDQLSALGWSKTELDELSAIAGSITPDPQIRDGGARSRLEPSSRLPSASSKVGYALHGAKPLPPSPRKFRVLYVSGNPHVASHQYRVDNYIVALGRNNIEADWIHVDECDDRLPHLACVSLVVFWRCILSAGVERFLGRAAEMGVPCIYDTDDYVFEPAIATPAIIDGIRFVPREEIGNYHRGVRLYRELLLRCQFATFPTAFLVDRGRELRRESFILRNGLDERTAEFARARRTVGPTRVGDGLIRIGYAGGTRTHQHDFAQCAVAVARVLEENAQCRLVLFQSPEGPMLELSEFPQFAHREHQIEWREFVPYERVVEELDRFDINTAPLEVGNPFCEGKSELKYFEAGVLGIPTVASATEAFCSAIRHGETGYLVRDGAHWYASLTALVRDPSLRRRMGGAAQEHVSNEYGPDMLGGVARRAYSGIISTYRRGRGRRDDALSVMIVLSPVPGGSGQHLAGLSLMRALRSSGHDVAFHFTQPPKGLPSADMMRVEYGFQDYETVSWGDMVPRPCDVLLAITEDAARWVKDTPNCAAAEAYLALDYGVHPASGESAAPVERWYRSSLTVMAYGPWVQQRLGLLGIEADCLPPVFDRSIFRPHPGHERSSNALVVFLPPDLPAEFFDLAISGIDMFLKETHCAIVIELIGGPVAGRVVPFPHRRHRLLPDEDMADLFRQGTVGIALSPGNPITVPFSMMASGLPVIDADVPGKAIAYGGAANVCLVATRPGDLAAVIAKLLAQPEELERMAANALAFIETLPGGSGARRRLDETFATALGLASPCSLAGKQA